MTMVIISIQSKSTKTSAPLIFPRQFQMTLAQSNLDPISQFQIASDQLLSGLEGTNWRIVENDTKQMKEYISKLKFTFTEIQAKLNFMNNLFTFGLSSLPTSTTHAGLTLLPEDAEKEELTKVKKEIEEVLHVIKEKSNSICLMQDIEQESSAKINFLRSSIDNLLESIQQYSTKIYPQLEFNSIQDAEMCKKELLTKSSKCDISIEQIKEDLEEREEAFKILQEQIRGFEREEAEFAHKSNEAIKARLNGNKEAEDIHKWLKEMQNISTSLLGTSLLKIHWKDTTQNTVSFEVGNLQVYAEFDPVDFSIIRYEFYLNGQPTMLKRFPVEVGDSLALLVSEVIEREMGQK